MADYRLICVQLVVQVPISMPLWWNSRHTALRTQRQKRAGATPVKGTNFRIGSAIQLHYKPMETAC